VGPDGDVYANQQADRRVRRLLRPGVWVTVIRGA
jgi:hypothetical protein